MKYPVVILLVRSYNRPEYLKNTLMSLLDSDIHMCSKRIIFDDCSNDPEVFKILHDPKIINVPDKEFEIVYTNKNVGCRRSFVEALQQLPDCDYICSVDDDVNVSVSFIDTLLTTYQEAFVMFKTHNMLVTGFNPTNAHLNSIQKYPNFYIKKSCGGVHYFFHNSFKSFVIDKWKCNADWGVCNAMMSLKYPLVCLNKGVVQHVGQSGLFSKATRYDNDANFGCIS